ncbi:MarR family winged helix-turn-helix transcriptional regulator [Actinopolymorpha alba]|uniref:MarR family winged helix-turn-helix transcriptional regulator n=1 Tax=Actinopolymorpha alba TaxID=533267 RepID=UPI000365CBA7|nr:MarR family winged helix-turn-helix transcriptional regulator [Actinopolymorpha alba]
MQAVSATQDPQGTPRDTSEALLVTLMRMLRLIKRAHDAPIEPALQYVLYNVNCTGPLRLSDLAAQVQLDISTVSRHVRALEVSGHLERAADPADKRAALLSVTESGRKVLHDTFARRRAVLSTALSAWPEADLNTLEHLLNRLADDLETELKPSAPKRSDS